jgi:hypothetical protein
MSETPFEAQRRKVRELQDKQESGGAEHPNTHVSSKAQARRDVEAAAKPVKKKSKKKTGASTTD